MYHIAMNHYPLRCILPPYMAVDILENITKPDADPQALGLSEPGLERLKTLVLDTLQRDQSFRSARLALAEGQRPVRTLRALARRRALAIRRVLGTGASIAGAPAALGQKQRTIYSAGKRPWLPGRVVRLEGSAAVSDREVNEAYDGLGDTYDLFLTEFGRNSIDGDGMPLNASVHYERGYDNAFWDGRRMVFGDGDGGLFFPFTRSVDVIGHELTHGVTEHEAGLIYWGQTGALNEHISDVFGSLVKQRRLNQTADNADWLIGAELLTPSPTRTALRSMREPGTAYQNDPLLGSDPQPRHMPPVPGIDDNGGVHINSGIPNRAFVVIAEAIGGFAWQKAGRIWYETLRSPLLRRTTKFQAFAILTLRTARLLYGANSPEQMAVRQGWADVGINI